MVRHQSRRLRSISPVWYSQNFLAKTAVARRLVSLTELGPTDTVVDLGAGHGELTAHLAARCMRVIAVEADPLLAHTLQQRFSKTPNVSVRNDDALRIRLPREPYTVVANIPFDYTARLLRRLTSAHHAPETSYVVVQREAAERMTGRTLFATLRQPWFATDIIYHLKRTDFVPSPRVDVVFLRMRKRGPPLLGETHRLLYDHLVEACFGSHAPSVRSTLETLLGYTATMRLARDLDQPIDQPPSRLALHTWIHLTTRIAEIDGLPERLDCAYTRRKWNW